MGRNARKWKDGRIEKERKIKIIRKIQKNIHIHMKINSWIIK